MADHQVLYEGTFQASRTPLPEVQLLHYFRILRWPEQNLWLPRYLLWLSPSPYVQLCRWFNFMFPSTHPGHTWPGCGRQSRPPYKPGKRGILNAPWVKRCTENWQEVPPEPCEGSYTEVAWLDGSTNAVWSLKQGLTAGHCCFIYSGCCHTGCGERWWGNRE